MLRVAKTSPSQTTLTMYGTDEGGVDKWATAGGPKANTFREGNFECHFVPSIEAIPMRHKERLKY